jgi:hypothetical protein
MCYSTNNSYEQAAGNTSKGPKQELIRTKLIRNGR